MEKMKAYPLLILGTTVCLALLTSCDLSETTAVSPPIPTSTPIPLATSTPTPTPTPSATSTPIPTSTPTPTPTPEAVALPLMQLNLSEGDVYRVRMISDQLISQTIEGQQQDTRQKIGFIYSNTVTNVDGLGNVSIEIVYDWILFEQDGPTGTFVYDSSDPPDDLPPEVMGYSALLGNGFTMVTTPLGEILEIEGLDEMYTDMLNSLEITDPALRQQFEEAFRQLYNEETLKEQMNSVVFSFPESSIQVGDSWNFTTEATSFAPLITENTFTLRSFDGNVATIDMFSTVTSDENSEVDFGIFKVRYSLSGVQEGVTTVDVGSGWIISVTATQEFSGEITMIFEGEEITAPMSITSTSLMETME